MISYLLWQGRIQRWCERHPIWMLLFIPSNMVGVLLLPRMLQIPDEHVVPLVLWMVLLNLGLLMILITQHGNKIRLQTVMRGIGIATLWVTIPILLLEVGLRGYFLTLGTEADRIAYVYTVDYALELTNRYVGDLTSTMGYRQTT